MYYFHSKDFEKRFKWTGIGSISIDPSKINDAIMKQNSAKISQGVQTWWWKQYIQDGVLIKPRKGLF
jgi:hypothetical protein